MKNLDIGREYHKYIADAQKVTIVNGERRSPRIIVSIYLDCPLEIEEKFKKIEWIIVNRFKSIPGAFVHQN